MLYKCVVRHYPLASSLRQDIKETQGDIKRQDHRFHMFYEPLAEVMCNYEC